MDNQKFIQEQRNLILKKYGIAITVYVDQSGNYKYILSNSKSQLVTAYRDSKDETDALFEIITYLDSAPHKIALAKADAYDDCLVILEEELNRNGKRREKSDAYLEIKSLFRKARQVYLEEELKEIGIENIKSLECMDVIELENARPDLVQLYCNLVWLKETAEQQGVDYESMIVNRRQVPPPSMGE